MPFSLFRGAFTATFIQGRKHGGIAMSILFEPTKINGMSLSNRFVRSATWEGMAAADGTCTDRLSDFLVRLADGGVGLIIIGHSYVSREGQAGPWQLGIHDPAAQPGLTRLTEAIHRHGGKVAAQLAHAGAYADTSLSGVDAIAPTVPAAGGRTRCREMEPEEIARVVRAFADAAARAKSSGFDAVQIHAAHGYLLSEFLSPAFNRRTDQYGGPLANRGRIVVEVVRGIRQAVGLDYPVLIKINSEDFIEGGFSIDEMLELSVVLERAGIDAIELSGGTGSKASKYSPVRIGPISNENEGYYRDAARRLKQQITVPLILVGGIRSSEVAERLVANGTADYIALSRPLICEPDLVLRWKNGDKAKSACLSDNRCFKPIMAGNGLRCLVWDKD